MQISITIRLKGISIKAYFNIKDIIQLIILSTSYTVNKKFMKNWATYKINRILQFLENKLFLSQFFIRKK